MDAYDFTLNPYSWLRIWMHLLLRRFLSPETLRSGTTGAPGSTSSRMPSSILSRPRQQAKLDGALIYMSSVTDAYQPVERELKHD